MDQAVVTPLGSGGALDGGPQNRMSFFTNGNVACHCRLFAPLSYVKF